MYISEEEYYRVCEEIDDGQTINIYKSKNIEIDIKRSGKKIYKFIADYGECSLNECLEDIEITTPPFAVPSSLVTTIPFTGTA